MNDHLDNFLAAQHAFSERVHSISEDQWQAGTPDSEWSVADLVAHLVEEHRWAAALVHGMDLDTARKIVAGSRNLPVDGGVGANLAELWNEACAGSADAFSGDGALDRQVALSRGSTGARDYCSEMIFDLVVHSWDLQVAIGYDGELPADLVDTVYAQAQSLGDLAASDMFDAPVTVADDAPTIDKLVALTGRAPQS
ncbi:MAG: TIGR03086 family metal-binding protein [Jatrophihabitans sp.]